MTSETPRATFPRPVVMTVVGLAIVALTLIVWRPAWGDSKEAVTPGQRSDGQVAVEKTSTPWWSPLPYGEVVARSRVGRAVTNGDPAASSNGDAAASRTEGRVRWVTVSWETSSRNFATQDPVWPATSAKQRQEKPSSLVLMAGGERYVVTKRMFSDRGAGTATIAVASAAKLHVRVVTDRVGRRALKRDDAPNFDPTDQTSSYHACEKTPDRGKVRFDVHCDLNARRSKTVIGLGRAPRGHDWLLIEDSGPRRDGLFTVATWWPGKKSDFYPVSQGGRVDYQPAGKPTLKFAVTGTTKPTKTAGKPTLTSQEVRSETRAYLVRSDKPVTVTMTYRTAAKAHPRTKFLPGAPKTMDVVVRTRARYKTIDTPYE